MARVLQLVAASLAAWVVAVPAIAQTAETPSGRVPAERRVGVEIGGDWTGDDWLAPGGTSYQVAGWVSKIGLSLQGEWNGKLEAKLTSSRTPLFRTDSQQDITRWGERLLVTWTQGRFQQKRVEGDYQIDAGLGLIGDVQIHQGGVPVARSRDYLDETQTRLGPVLRGDILWFHPTDPAWRANLNVLVMPRLLGVTTGNVAYPGGWSGIEAAIGPNYRLGNVEIRAGLEGKIWAGGSFIQRAGGLYLQGSYQF